MPKCSVLLVEDDDDIRESFAFTLADEGYTVHQASNGQEAIGLLIEKKIEVCLIILDLMMPVMNGWGFRSFQLTNDRLQSIPVVAVTAFADMVPPPGPPLDAGLRVLRKPMSADELVNIVKTYCDGAA